MNDKPRDAARAIDSEITPINSIDHQDTPNNQPKFGGSIRGDDRGEARWAESEGEGVGVSFGGGKKGDNKIKK